MLRKLRRDAVAAWIAVLFCILALPLLKLCVPNNLDLLQKVIQQVKALPLPPQSATGRNGDCVIDGIQIMYEVEGTANQYTIYLWTEKHAGYIYSDLTRLPAQGSDPGYLIEEQVTPHWWRISSDPDDFFFGKIW